MSIALSQYPDQSSFQLHLSHLLSVTDGVAWRPKIRECPIARALLRCKRETQVKILLAALARRLWLLAGRTPKDLARLYLLNDICRSILSKKLPFKENQLEATLLLVSEPTAASELGKLVLRQLDWQPPLTQCERVALTKLKRVFVHNKEFKQATRTNRKLSAAQPVQASAETLKWKRLLAHLRKVPSKLSLRWRKKAKALLLDFGEDIVLERLLPWFEREKERLLREEERFVRGLVSACGEMKNPQVAELLDRIVQWSFQHIQGRGPRAARVGHLAVSALGRMATKESFTFLVALESSSPYSSLQKWIREAQHSSARYQGLSPTSLRADGLLDPEPNSPLGRRLRRSFCFKLERLLRNGEWISPEVWAKRAEHSKLWLQLAERLVWESKSDMTLGLPQEEVGPIRLWHPAEHPHDKAVWKRLVKHQPIAQIERKCFHLRPTEQSPPLDQYRFGALARRRWWNYHLVGRRLASTRATLNLGSRIEMAVRRSGPRGPFHSNGLAKKVVLSPPTWETRLSPRQLSEVVRDWQLFLGAATRSENKNGRGD